MTLYDAIFPLSWDEILLLGGTIAIVGISWIYAIKKGEKWSNL